MPVWEMMEQGQALRQARQPFALATVVRCERPASARPGDQALVTPEGRLHGWIGGSCAEPIIIREALESLRRGQARLVRLGPPDARPGVASEGMVFYPMTCHSGGTLEVFVEPCLPKPQALLVGHAPVIESLAALSAAAGFAVVVCAPQASTERFPGARRVLPALDPSQVALDPATYVVVATHGETDDEALAVALRGQATYVALVSSRRRAALCRETLLAMGLTPEQVAPLKAPAGLDLGATTPAQIAVSILAEMVQHLCSATPAWSEQAQTPQATAVGAVDPVCGMAVEIGEETPSHTHEGETYYFCCAGCRGQFQRDPARFLAASTG